MPPNAIVVVHTTPAMRRKVRISYLHLVPESASDHFNCGLWGGTKLYAFTAVVPNNSDIVQYVLRFTPSSSNNEGAWSVVVTKKPGSISALDVHQSK